MLISPEDQVPGPDATSANLRDGQLNPFFIASEFPERNREIVARMEKGFGEFRRSRKHCARRLGPRLHRETRGRTLCDLD